MTSQNGFEKTPKAIKLPKPETLLCAAGWMWVTCPKLSRFLLAFGATGLDQGGSSLDVSLCLQRSQSVAHLHVFEQSPFRPSPPPPVFPLALLLLITAVSCLTEVFLLCFPQLSSLSQVVNLGL